MFEDLTDRQVEFLRVIMKQHMIMGKFPTFRTIRKEMNVISSNSVTQFKNTLRDKGYLKKEGKRWTFTYKGMDQCPLCKQGIKHDDESVTTDKSPGLLDQESFTKSLDPPKLFHLRTQ